MKKNLLAISFLGLLAYGTVDAQSSIPNGNFETWTPGTFEYPANYPYNSNSDNFWMSLPFNLTKSTDAQQGTYAAQITTINQGTDTAGAYFICGNPNGPNWHGGIPYSQKPTGMSGYYKCNVVAGDSALVIASFSKAGTNIGMYFFKIGGVKTTYTQFNFTFTPALAVTPDSVMFGATSSDFISNVMKTGSTLKLDNISFTGVTSQPALLNGSFETWQNQTLEKPNSWYVQDYNGLGFSKTTDNAAGSAAVQLTTYLGDNNGTPAARAGRLATGYYDNACGCMKGGYPFSNQIDTLVFQYKYTPASNDTAEIYLDFKKNGISIFGLYHQLTASSSWQTVTIPFNTGLTPDSVTVNIASTIWSDSSVAFVGSVLKIDEIHFKSQPLNTSILELTNDNRLVIFPNPCNGLFTINKPDKNITGISNPSIEVINMLGERIFSSSVLQGTIDLRNYPKGIYSIQLSDNDRTYTGSIVIQ